MFETLYYTGIITKKFIIRDDYASDKYRFIVQYLDNKQYKTKTIKVSYEAYSQYEEGEKTLVVR